MGGRHVCRTQHSLSNLIAIVDMNGKQALAHTEDVLDLSPLTACWNAFGWEVSEVDGHNVEALVDVITRLNMSSGPPHVVIARTVSGKGVSYMENEIKWHYWPMSDEEYQQALDEIATFS